MEKKTKFKMYKAGKKWCIAAMTLLALTSSATGLINVGGHAYADDTEQTQTATDDEKAKASKLAEDTLADKQQHNPEYWNGVASDLQAEVDKYTKEQTDINKVADDIEYDIHDDTNEDEKNNGKNPTVLNLQNQIKELEAQKAREAEKSADFAKLIDLVNSIGTYYAALESYNNDYSLFSEFGGLVALEELNFQVDSKNAIISNLDNSENAQQNLIDSRQLLQNNVNSLKNL